jgi:hypothetical protein
MIVYKDILKFDWNNASIVAHGYQYSSETTRAFIKQLRDSGFAITITESPVIRVEDNSNVFYPNMAFMRVFEEESVSYINFLSWKQVLDEPSLFMSGIESSEIRWNPDFGTWPSNLTSINYISPYKPLLPGFCDESADGINYTYQFKVWVIDTIIPIVSHIAFYNLDFDSGPDSLFVKISFVASSYSKI